MEKRVVVTDIVIVTEKQTEVLSKYKIKKFCAEKLQINIIKTPSNSEKIKGENQDKPSNHRTINNTKLQLVKKKIMPDVGTFCFAKVRGYSEWPAIITSIKNPNHVWLRFFNSNEIACLPLEKIFSLEEGLNFLDKYKSRKTGFVKAVKEMAIALKDIKRQHKSKVDDVLKIYIAY
ncbi:uncharacterized protein LOC116351971 [Contarinia nasturtii]|uniref:uncharacterized protein LOC116351971 n=1 Tax=Contarinia nasturtii TaxID=265458 RepID=UPI0012D4784B|nr:uncharacterized protein LOC116351971 [Contarinia nasturtii]